MSETIIYEAPIRKTLIKQLHSAKNPRYAVFLRSPSGANAKFLKIHTSKKSAVEVARKHASDLVAAGIVDFTYYVVQIVHRVGIEHGSVVDKDME